MANDETIKLLKYAERVCVAVLAPDVAKSISISVHESDTPSDLGIKATHEFMIVLNFSIIPEHVTESRQILVSFLEKHVEFKKVGKNDCLYWGVGEPIDYCHTFLSSEPEKTTSSPIDLNLDSLEWMNTNTVLPAWLDSVLFDLLNARYAPDWKRYEYNLNLNEEEIQIYLGTYFARSYAEAFCILDALLENKAYAEILKEKAELAILDVGTGTGGNLVGILTALSKHCSNLKKVTVHGFDGNTLALEAAKVIVSSFASRVSFTIDLALEECQITTLDRLPTPILDSYDFVTTFKMGGEIVSKVAGDTNEFYYHFLSTYANRLTNFGLLQLLDVTIKPERTDYLPLLLNKQALRFVREHSDYCTLIPIPCFIYETQCTESCFTQKEFSVTHRAAHRDRSRVVYRVLVRSGCAQIFHKSTVKDAEFIINAKPGNICNLSSGRGKLLDGYRVCNVPEV